MPVNQQTSGGIMREDSLLALQPKRFKITTNSNHKFEIYLNLAARMKLTGINQLWVADITYIRLKTEFVYLAVILDGFSRKVVGWALDRTLAMQLTVGALEQAIERRQPEPGLVHHSDRGFQYAHVEYTTILEKYHMVPSMSRSANPYDNASCESFISNDADRVKGFFRLFLNLFESLLFLVGHTSAFAQVRRCARRIIFRRRSLIRVHPTRSAPCHFIVLVSPTNHLFDHSGP